jgi:hypothetical protein
VFVLLGLSFAFQPLYEHDLWWHLKTGELMAQSRALLPFDPFNFTTGPDLVGLRERTLLDGYWLWQVVAYGFSAVLGLMGVKVLNALSLLAIYAVAILSMRRSGVRNSLIFTLSAMSLVLFQKFYFGLERPQTVSFLFLTILVGLMVAIRRGSKPGWGLFPVMILWGNVHGGVIFGSTALALFALGACWEYRSDRLRLRRLLLWSGGGLLCSLLNPNGIDTYLALLEMRAGGFLDFVIEYNPTHTLFARDKAIVLLAGLLLLHFFSLWRTVGRGHLTDWLVSIFLALMAARYARNLAFVAVALLPMTGFYLERLLKEAPGLVRYWRGVWLTTGIVFVLHTATVVFAAVDSGRWRQAVHDIPLARVTDFIERTGLPGNIFCEYADGGYLVWRLYPRNKTYMDSRALNGQAVLDYVKIVGPSLAKVDGRYEFRKLLDDYGVDMVVFSLVDVHMVVNPLLKHLLLEPEWSPIYIDSHYYVLVKGPAGKGLALDKKLFLDTFLTSFDAAIRSNPEDPGYRLGRGDLLGYLGRYAEAARDFATVQRLDPANPALPAKLRQLEKLREQAQRH